MLAQRIVSYSIQNCSKVFKKPGIIFQMHVHFPTQVKMALKVSKKNCCLGIAAGVALCIKKFNTHVHTNGFPCICRIKNDYSISVYGS